MGIGSNVQDALDEFLMILSISVTVQGAKVFICSEEANRTEFRSKDKGATSFPMVCCMVLMFAILDTKKSLKAVARSCGFARFRNPWVYCDLAVSLQCQRVSYCHLHSFGFSIGNTEIFHVFFDL